MTHGVKVEEQTAPTASANIDNFTKEREDVIVGFDVKKVKGEDGTEKTEKTPNVRPAGETTQKLITDGKFLPDYSVTTSYDLPKNWAGLIALGGNDEKIQEELVNNHNRGVVQKVTNRRNAALLAQNDDGSFSFDESVLKNGVLDLTEHITSPSKRKTLTEEQKFERMMEAQGIAKGSKKFEAMKSVWLQSFE